MQKESKIRVALVFGGKSSEHEVSVRSAASIYKALDKTKYDVTLLGVDKLGKWQVVAPKWLPAFNEMKLLDQGDAISPTELLDGVLDKTVFFPIIHGTTGEDGAIQGLFELLDVAYVGSGVLGSAIGMDKDVQKRLLRAAGISVAEFAVLRNNVLTHEVQEFVDQRGFPVFVKPVNMGSSVGVTKAHNQDEFEKAIEIAFGFDMKVMVEEFVDGRELEVAILGNGPYEVSVVGEIVPTLELYDYESKYINAAGADVQISAEISEKQMKEVQKLAVRVCETLEVVGMARVDLFLRDDGRTIVNEINTLPGFTSISMYPKLWEASGLSYAHLLDRLIVLAMEQRDKKDGLKRSFSS